MLINDMEVKISSNWYYELAIEVVMYIVGIFLISIDTTFQFLWYVGLILSFVSIFCFYCTQYKSIKYYTKRSVPREKFEEKEYDNLLVLSFVNTAFTFNNYNKNRIKDLKKLPIVVYYTADKEFSGWNLNI